MPSSPHPFLLLRQQGLKRAPTSWIDGVTLARLLQARELIEDCYGEPLRLEVIAAAAQLSPHHFHRLYKKHFGQTPHQHLTQRRLAQAKRLLATTSLSVTEVCFEVGFESLGSFSDLFKRHTGQSPVSFRRKLYHLGWRSRPRCAPLCMYARFFMPLAQDSKIQEVIH